MFVVYFVFCHNKINFYIKEILIYVGGMKLPRLIGFESLVKTLMVFTMYGFFTVLYIYIRYGFDKDLPTAVDGTFQGPMSFYTFGWLGLAGVLSIIFSTKFGSVRCDIEKKRPRMFFYFALPICEAAISVGLVIGVTLLGGALCSNMLSIIGMENSDIHPAFYSFSIFMFLVTFPIYYIAIVLLDFDNKKVIYQRALGGGYLLVIIFLLYTGLPVIEVVQIGAFIAFFTMLICLCKVLRNKLGSSS
ncbi:hypothetical protein ACEUB3_18120 [Aeromonas caviae]|uniref:hypothetical protein n=2 Tax=Aeromonas caviae TaxID=648 RepID=UPI0029D824EE|nr:hypothetical protein [Aeromonas caviae]MDX7873328.1 hypothetical protein [Aeromonas caviae]